MAQYEDISYMDIGNVNVILRHPGEDGAVPGFEGDHIELECNADAGSVQIVGSPEQILVFAQNLVGAVIASQS